MTKHSNLIVVGGGLSGLITAWRCLDQNPELSVKVIEKSSKLGGDHTWSFNLSDIRPELHDWIRPLIAHQWSEYEVRFPKRKRVLDIPYCSTHSKKLFECIQPYIENSRLSVVLGEGVTALSSTFVTLDNGDHFTADCVLDARGFVQNDKVILGYQKFVGHTIKTQKPHGLKSPIIMDATVAQLGGYRFVYCLPFSDTEILVEDTYYTDEAELNSQELDARIKDYIRDTLNIKNYTLERREKGVLPITLAVESEYGSDVTDDGIAPVQLGMTGGYYHAVTGYSFPEAVKSACVVSDMIQQNWPDFRQAVRHEMIYHKRDHYFEEKFLRLLNRMLFRAANPEKRYKVLQRFYGMPEGLIERFYRNRLTKTDKIRILSGKPPVPVTKALYNFDEKAFIKRERQARNQT